MSGVQRVSEVFGLKRTQGTLDFVDVPDSTDVRLYVDPRAITLLQSDWGQECVYLIQNFFATVLDHIRSGNKDEARRLLLQLREPNEVRLGNSQGLPRGSALGEILAGEVLDALTVSEAVKTGLLSDLEDTVLMIENINRDRISDITINIIREPLIRYTQSMCDLYGIPLTDGVESGPLWDPKRKEWYIETVKLPVTSFNKLILVPKSVVRQDVSYNSEQYYRHYIVPLLQDQELAAQSSLVELLKNKSRRVTKKSIYGKYGKGKHDAVRETLLHPEALERYKNDKRNEKSGPIDQALMSDLTGSPEPDFDALLKAVTDVVPGNEGATAYHRAVEALLSALFDPTLTMPILERELHSNRKRIDISYTNVAAGNDFFSWVSKHYPAGNIFVECKNYSKDPKNPEVDQLRGRFAPSRGMLGLLVYRNSKDKEAILQRCADTVHDQAGYILALDDADLTQLVSERMSGTTGFGLLRARFDQLIFNNQH